MMKLINILFFIFLYFYIFFSLKNLELNGFKKLKLLDLILLIFFLIVFLSKSLEFFKFNIIFFYIYFYTFSFLLIKLIRICFFYLLIMLIENKKNKFIEIKSISFFLANFFGVSFLKFYILFLNFFSKFNYFIFPTILFYFSYNIIFLIILYFILSFLFDIDKLDSDLNQALIGHYQNIPIKITYKGNLKLNFYKKFVINSYFNLFNYKYEFDRKFKLNKDFYYKYKNNDDF